MEKDAICGTSANLKKEVKNSISDGNGNDRSVDVCCVSGQNSGILEVEMKDAKVNKNTKIEVKNVVCEVSGDATHTMEWDMGDATSKMMWTTQWPLQVEDAQSLVVEMKDAKVEKDANIAEREQICEFTRDAPLAVKVETSDSDDDGSDEYKTTCCDLRHEDKVVEVQRDAAMTKDDKAVDI